MMSTVWTALTFSALAYASALNQRKAWLVTTSKFGLPCSIEQVFPTFRPHSLAHQEVVRRHRARHSVRWRHRHRFSYRHHCS